MDSWGGAEESHEVNDEAGNAESVYYRCVGGRGRREREYIFHKINMTGHKYFFEGRVNTEKGTLSEGVPEKDT